MKKISIVISLLLALVILIVSLVRANLETVIKEERENRIRVTPIEIITETDNGERLKSVFYLPKIKIYPNNILYPFKIWRDNLWLFLTKDPCQRAKLLILIADKQMAEEDEISANEAVDKLISSWRLCPQNKFQLKTTIKAYRQITSKMRKYSQTNEKIEKFIEEQKIILE